MQRIWLALTPIMFLILWSTGYVVAKVALVDAAPYGAAGTEVCRRYCHYGGAICNFIPTVAQNPKGLAAPRIGRIFDANHIFRYDLFRFCKWCRRRHSCVDLLAATPAGRSAGAATECRNGKLAAMAGLGNCYDWNLCGDRRPA